MTIPVTTAICIEHEGLLDANLACGAAGGDGSPIRIDSAKVVGPDRELYVLPVDTHPDRLRRI